jgi:hypothetical protein
MSFCRTSVCCGHVYGRWWSSNMRISRDMSYYFSMSDCWRDGLYSGIMFRCITVLLCACHWGWHLQCIGFVSISKHVYVRFWMCSEWRHLCEYPLLSVRNYV